MASSGDTATPEKIPVSDTEVVSVDLPAPDGWRKKFTPRKGGTPKRNEIMFISPTGEEITTKRQLEQYLRSHAGGPPSSEFDWGTGDTPRRSARLSSKSKATETLEDERPKKERKSSSKKDVKDKSGDTETETPEEAKGAAANERSADLEMTDAEGHAKNEEEVVCADPVDQGKAENKLEEKTKEDVEVETEEHNKEGPEESVKADTDASIPESGKEERKLKKHKMKLYPTVAEEKGDENSEKADTDASIPESGKEEKEVKETQNEDLPTVAEEKGDENAEKEKGDENAEKKLEDSETVHPAEEKENGKGNDEDPVVPPQTSEVHKEEAPTDRDGIVPSKNDDHIDNRDGTASNGAQSANREDGQHQPKAPRVEC
ncbi:methyl-CpG-binding domain-containing protein 10-like [Iris pallida]|uniref:Methyl-CpG-binding domain-containing protein 10-like n=1 Tax=Iris pallida TaxID=29817 RepID=A0AAX6HZU6_IRIPA|nr:methyl-CpG-binding domain-containing protein 10-like [Iris pallida]